MFCPRCQSQLQVAQHEGIEIDYCPRCQGVWLDRGELDKIIARASTIQQNYFAGEPTKRKNDAGGGMGDVNYKPLRKRKNDTVRRDDDDDDDKKERSGLSDMVEEIFDIFDIF